MPALLSHRQPDSRSGWFDTPIAQCLLGKEQREVIPLLTAHIGVRGLYIRPSPGSPATLSGNMLRSVIHLHHENPDALGGDVRCKLPALPIEDNALCLLYALHSLDQAVEPRTVLDEFQRVLRPEGVLFLLGLSPTSAWRLRWMGNGLTPRSPAVLRALLGRAGLSVESQHGVGPLLPALKGRDPAAAERGDASLLDPLRAGYLLIARKRRPTLTRVLPSRRPMGALQPQAGAGA